MADDRTRSDASRTLTPERAFVVHFATTARRRPRFVGRVEHLTSGRSARFSSRAALWAFIAGLLDAPPR
jgi:hypothetical protein